MSRRIHTFTLPKNRSSEQIRSAPDIWFRRITTLLVGALAAIAAAAAVSASASGSSTSFETGTEPLTTLECANPSTQFTRVTSPVREGAYSARFSETPTDVWSNGTVRCLAAKYDSGETTGDDYYYHLSLYIPSNGVTTNLLWELHTPAALYNVAPGGCAVAPFALHTDGTRLLFRIATGDCLPPYSAWAHWEPNLVIPGLDPYPRNTWIDFVFHIKFAESSTGVVQVYARTGSNPWPATPQISRSNIPTLPFYSGGGVHNVKLYWEMGLYPGYSGYNHNDVIYLDDVRRETSLSAAIGGATVTASAPSSTSLPQVSGTAQVGQILTASTGGWSNSPTSYSYRWQVSSSGGSSWVDVAGGTGATLTVGSASQGALARVIVTAANSAGSATATSSSVGPIAAAAVSGGGSVTGSAPVNTLLPTVSGSPQVGQSLATTTGVWAGSPTSFAYQWQYSRDSGATWLNVNGATLTTFQETSTFQSTLVRVRMTATNSSGSMAVASAAVGPIAAASTTSPPPPTSTAAPFSVATNLVDGQRWKKRWGAMGWTATASVPVTTVEFWIDGTRGWTDSSSPYAYGASGVLDVAPLVSGGHTMTVKASAADGRTATKTVVISIR